MIMREVAMHIYFFLLFFWHVAASFSSPLATMSFCLLQAVFAYISSSSAIYCLLSFFLIDLRSICIPFEGNINFQRMENDRHQLSAEEHVSLKDPPKARGGVQGSFETSTVKKLEPFFLLIIKMISHQDFSVQCKRMQVITSSFCEYHKNPTLSNLHTLIQHLRMRQFPMDGMKNQLVHFINLLNLENYQFPVKDIKHQDFSQSYKQKFRILQSTTKQAKASNFPMENQVRNLHQFFEKVRQLKQFDVITTRQLFFGQYHYQCICSCQEKSQYYQEQEHLRFLCSSDPNQTINSDNSENDAVSLEQLLELHKLSKTKTTSRFCSNCRKQSQFKYTMEFVKTPIFLIMYIIRSDWHFAVQAEKQIVLSWENGSKHKYKYFAGLTNISGQEMLQMTPHCSVHTQGFIYKRQTYV